MLHLVIDIPLIAVQALVLASLALLWAPVLLRLALHGRYRAMRRADAAVPADRSTRFAVLIPAHNEEAVIGRLLGSLAAQDYPRERLAVHVVSDNSRDRTAEVARAAGFACYERFSEGSSSKGQALTWLWDRLQAEDQVPEDAVVVILDADCTVAPDYFTQLDRAFAAGAAVVQSNRTVLGIATSPITSLEAATEELRQQTLGAARRLVGLSGYLCGSGIAFRRPVFDRLIAAEGVSESITEDMFWQVWLVRHGHKVVWWPGAMLFYEAVRDMGEFRKQRNRWVGERVRGIFRRGLPLVWRGLRTASPTAVDQGLYLMQLPRSVLAVLLLALGGLAFAWPAGPVLPAALWVGLLASLAIYLLTGFILLRAPLKAYASLLILPLIVAQVTRISLATALGRTARRWEAVRHGNEWRIANGERRHLQPLAEAEAAPLQE